MDSPQTGRLDHHDWDDDHGHDNFDHNECDGDHGHDNFDHNECDCDHDMIIIFAKIISSLIARRS